MEPSQSRYMHWASDHVPLSIKTDATLSAYETDRATKLAAARTVRRYVTRRGGARRNVMMQLFGPHRLEQLPPGQRLGLIP